ncbi:histidine kinase [Ancylobacter sp. 6x-1]|uniref:Histidine kinase n=1 Tax=Ancylobacter crimeensis TaxID=2579147 RepID=A0ABT0DDC9_9HYPH|nr:LapD/MoxY N-terminal periplasmic domain-containing protein [Ancylobacter crimeensis]MCK0197961.1 histidine kinase [Ancylobacter crimeensis]
MSPTSGVLRPARGGPMMRLRRGGGHLLRRLLREPWTVLWRARSLRVQVLAVLVAANLVAGLGAAALVVANARRATNVEISASLAIAARFVEGQVQRLAARGGASASLAELPLHIGGLRHVRIRIEDAKGRVLDVTPNESSLARGDDVDGDGERDAVISEVPAWFTRLVDVAPMSREISIHDGTTQLGRVLVSGESADEIAEVWEDMSSLTMLALVVNVAILAALYIALGRLFAPLRDLSAGMQALEAGRFQHRLGRPRMREFEAINARFNALAGALQLARADNERLTRRLVTVQDDERARIAAELHDELGPCLFGVRANLESVARLAEGAESVLAARLAERTATATDIVDRIQLLNRRLLRSIRPMALGHVPLNELLAELLADFGRTVPDRSFTLTSTPMTRSYEEGVGLTIYRCAQEGVTNAVRHGAARHVVLRLAETGLSDRPTLTLVVEDDGTGIRPGAEAGYGLTGIGERVAALGGRWSIRKASTRGRWPGTRVEVEIPVTEGGQVDREGPARPGFLTGHLTGYRPDAAGPRRKETATS